MRLQVLMDFCQVATRCNSGDLDHPLKTTLLLYSRRTRDDIFTREEHYNTECTLIGGEKPTLEDIHNGTKNDHDIEAKNIQILLWIVHRGTKARPGPRN